jgi:hypothetical protein
MKKNLLTMTVLLIPILVAGASFAADQTVKVSGSSAISIEDAVRQAQRLAVEEAAGIFVQSHTEVKNFILQKDKIISKTQGYITRYQVLSSNKSGSDYVVEIEATVSLDKIKDDLIALKILLEGMQRPKLMVLIDEDYKNMADFGMQIAGTELSARLTEKKFDLVDRAQLEAAKTIDQQQQALAGNTAAAASLGLHFGAQYVIVGKAVAEDAGEAFPGSGLHSMQVSLQLQVINSQTAAVLGSTVKNDVVAHVSQLTGATQAFQSAAGRAVDEYLLDAITDSFQDFLNNGAPIKLHVAGVKTFSDYKVVANGIEAIDRINAMKKEGWNRAGELLVLDLRFKGTSEELAELLDNRKLGQKSLMVIDFAPDRVNCALQ